MIALSWPCVVALKLEPIGPIAPEVVGLAWDRAATDETAMYRITDPHKVRILRDALGQWVDSPTGERRPEKTPFYTMLCNLHLALTEG